VELKRGLVAKPLEHRRREPRDPEVGGRVRKGSERLDAGPVEPLDLVAPDPRDERQMVVLLPAPAADGMKSQREECSQGHG
jgi:hypothetical protein